MSKAGFLLLLGGFAWPIAAVATDYSVDFERQSPMDSIQTADWISLGFPGVGFVNGPERTLLDSQVAHGGTNSLRITFPEGAVGPSKGGYQAAIQLAPAEQYYLSYWLKFDRSFSWGNKEQGGKLPGLAQGKLCSGGDICDGHNGFTARYMWRRDGAAVLYLYHMDKPHQWGEDFELTSPGHQPLFFTPGEWVNLVQRVRINTNGDANGEVQVWVNGIEALNLRSLRFVNDGSKVDTFYLSAFHGGNTPDWGPLHESHIWIDDIQISVSNPGLPHHYDPTTMTPPLPRISMRPGLR